MTALLAVILPLPDPMINRRTPEGRLDQCERRHVFVTALGAAPTNPPLLGF